MNRYKYLFFDLDHTLWDYETNSGITLQEMYTIFDLDQSGIDLKLFKDTFREINDQLWYKFNHALINREYIRKERFRMILSQLNASDDNKAAEMSDWFLEHAPKQKTLIDGALDILHYLEERYHMLILTNGFEKIQHTKIQSSGLERFFKHVITSETIGVTKPDNRIFHYAVNLSNHNIREVLMIGDNLNSDIEGSKNAGIDSVFFNPQKIHDPVGANFNIHSLYELKSIL